jgi:hypothetical protein
VVAQARLIGSADTSPAARAAAKLGVSAIRSRMINATRPMPAPTKNRIRQP